MSYLLHPEMFGQVPLQGERIAGLIDEQADDIALQHHFMDPNTETKEPSLTVAIRTLNEADSLQKLLVDIGRQSFDGEVEIIVVDNESTDDTAGVAKEFGANVVTLPRDDFTYPRSMNLAMDAASHDAVFLTVGHANLSNTQTWRGGLRHFQVVNQGGAFAGTLPNTSASWIDKWVIASTAPLFKEPREVSKVGIGVLGATNAIVSKRAWLDVDRFDEAYESGGEDTALAKKMLAAGYHIVREPLLAVHHSHDLGTFDSAKQWMHWWRTVYSPGKLDKSALAARRPDIDFS